MRKNKDITEMSVKEYYNYFRECHMALIRKAFDKKDILVHVSYQPDILTLDHNQVKVDTKLLFDKYTYVQVLERNFVKRSMYNDANYSDGFHAHIVMKDSDYIKIEHELNALDIKATTVYDLEGLIEWYLSKQAVNKYNRLLPSLHNPPIVAKIKEAIEEKVITPLKKKTILFKKAVIKALSSIKRFITIPVLEIINRIVQVHDTT